jgi:hypothetical protein
MTPPISPENGRDAAILEHLRRYHLTTPEILHRLFFPGVGLNAVRKVTSRLIRERRISPARLFEQRKYFVLTPREAERLGEHRSIGRKFEYQGLVNAYGLLAFCAANGVKKFTPREFAEQFPDFVIPGVRSGNYYLEPEDASERPNHRLAFIHVDYGIGPNVIVKKVKHIITRAYRNRDFAKLIQGGQFMVTVLTPTETKAAEIKAALTGQTDSLVSLRIHPLPELAELLTHRGRLKENRKPKPNRATTPATPSTSPVEVTPATPATEVTP